MKIAEIEKLMNLLRDAKISELAVSVDGDKVSLRKPLTAASPSTGSTSSPQAGSGQVSQPPAASNQEPEVSRQHPVSSIQHPDVYITAPMVGIFHRLDTLKVGAAVKTGQAVAAIESMKLMNDVVSEYDGVIVEILVEDGMPVEYGHNLFRLK